MPFDCVIVGGGVIGLGIAEALARRGQQVCLLEAARATREASWAAAGMLAPHNEANRPDALWRLACASLDRWQDYLRGAEIAEADVDFRQRGSLIPVLDSDDEQRVEARCQWLCESGVLAHWWSHETLLAAEPALAGHAKGALWVPGGQVNPRLLAQRLRQRCSELGVEVRFDSPVATVSDQEVILETGERLRSARIVIAAGAWTPELGRMIGFDLEGEPIKGQMLRFAAPAEQLLTHFVHCAHAYCVPRSDGGLVVGATMERVGFDRSQSEDAIAALADGARRVLPSLADHQIAETWTGMRPRLADGGPLLDAVDDHTFVSTGHFRNGILLLPITVETMVARICDEAVPLAAEPFGLRDAIRAGAEVAPLHGPR